MRALKVSTAGAAAASLALLAAAPAAQAGTEPYLGEIMITIAHKCPTDWEPADGRLKQVSTNAALFSLLGTNFGGDGRTTFALPDLRGRTVVGAGASMAGEAPLGAAAALGQKGGAEQTFLTAMQPPVRLGPSAKTSAGGTISGAVPGAGLPIATMPPWIGLTACIATTGFWPARP